MLRTRKFKGIIQIIISLALLIWLVNRAGASQVFETLSHIHLGWYLLAFSLFLLNIFIRAYRWFILHRSLNDQPSYLLLLNLYFVGFFADNFVPTGFASEVVKVVRLRSAFGRGTEALSSVVMDRVVGLLGSALIALLILLGNSLSRLTPLELPSALWTAVALISMGIPAGFLVVRWKNPLNYFRKRFPRLRENHWFEKVAALVNTVNRYSGQALMRSLLISLPFTISLAILQYGIARALSVKLPLSIFALYVPIIAVLNTIPFSFNGLGIREGVYQFLFVPIGVTSAAAIAMSLAFYLLRVGAGLIGGLILAVQGVIEIKKQPAESP